MKDIFIKNLGFFKNNLWLVVYVLILLVVLPITVIVSRQEQERESHAAAIPLAIDIQAARSQSTATSSIVSPTFTTRAGNELIVVFLTSTGPTGVAQSFSSVT